MGSHETFNAPTTQRKEWLEYSSASGGTQPFAAQTLMRTSARKCLLCTFRILLKSRFTFPSRCLWYLRFSRKRVSFPRLCRLHKPCVPMTTWRHLHSNLAQFFSSPLMVLPRRAAIIPFHFWEASFSLHAQG